MGAQAFTIYDLLARVQAQAKRGSPGQWYVFDAKRKLVAGPVSTRVAALISGGQCLPCDGHARQFAAIAC